jgi:hypothetical protein
MGVEGSVLLVMCGVMRGMIVATAMAVVAAGGLVGCGGSAGHGATVGSAGGGRVVVSFRGRGLSAGTIAHWDAVEAVLARELYPQQPPPRGLIPDPPRFTACIAYERATAPTPATGTPAATTAQLRQACRVRYEGVRTHMLQLLIGYEWMEAETAAHGIHVSDAEVQKAYERAEHIPFRTKTEFARYLRFSGQTPADEHKLVRFDVEAVDLREKIRHESGLPGLRKFYATYPRELAAQTSCSPGYVIAECKQYTGPQPPEG